MKRIMLLATISLSLSSAFTQMISNPEISDKLTASHWDASWISVPGAAPYDYGIYYFRNDITLDKVPEEYIVHVSADNRYKLYVNGQWIGLGPARSDADNWIYETYNLAPYLKEGKNYVGAVVWNYGRYKPWAQISLQTAFIVQGDDPNASALNTPGTWKCMESLAYSPAEVDRDALGTFIIVGPGDAVDGSKYAWNWATKEVDGNWVDPVVRYTGTPKGVGTDITHALVPRRIPAMELKKIDPPVIRMMNEEVIGEKAPLIDYSIPGNTKTTILLDQQELVTAYPELLVTGGTGAQIKISYAESMFRPDGSKPHRDSVAGMVFKGNSDIFITDGGDRRFFQPLWFRTFRYILIEIETSDNPLMIHGISPVFTAYPFKERAYFRSDNPSIEPIWQTAWRTSRLCANELYYDCPYYEQMQYVGDTRIQALITLYMSGDDRLMKKAIRDYYNSFNPEGLTQSRYPTEPRQIIPTYSLFWISMMHDYLLHRDDYVFIAQYLTNIQHVIKWFEDRVDSETGMLGPIEYWPFVDWTDAWPWDNEARIGGVPPGAQDGNSSIITLQFAMTLQQTADIFKLYGLDKLANEYLEIAGSLIEATHKHCWNDARGVYADTPEMNSFSLHANTFAVLAKALPAEDEALFMETIMRDPSLIQPSLYFRYYVNRAAVEAGLGNKYLDFLNPWHEMMKSGLTTFAEIPDTEHTRSDCHAWSSSPLYELLATVAGIMPGGAGFESVLIKPQPGNLQWIEAGIPHLNGEISVDLKFKKDGSVQGKVILPQGVNGLFMWDHQTIDLVPGAQKVALKSLNEKFKINP